MGSSFDEFPDVEKWRELAELQDTVERSELEILNTPIKDIGKIDVENMTVAQLIKFADAVDAIGVLTDYVKSLQPSDVDANPSWLTPANTERRGGSWTEAERERALASLTARLTPDAQVQTVSGPMSYSEIPKDERGNIPSAWIEANCPCDNHEQLRIDRDRSAKVGQYL